MSHQPRNFQPGFSYHVTTCCNNREFNPQEQKAFLQLGKRLDEYAKKYCGFCQRYKPKLKTAKLSYWGSKLLAGQPPLGEFKSQKSKVKMKSLFFDF
ncbi:MAG: hypothetical protein V7L29_23190 [Nostoc sp.]|uniref:hypothetical protein n=1 Tax=Nostoc sp. TaxID=1180 RepID=UPI002FF993D2